MIFVWGGARRALVTSLGRRLCGAATAALLGLLGAGCQACSGMATSLSDGITELTAVHGGLGGAPPGACSSDVMCPCGTFCDPHEHLCRPACMALPGIGAEGCVARNDARCLGGTGHR